MKVVTHLLKDTFADLPYLIDTPLDKDKKILIILSYLRLSFKLVFINRFKKLKSEKIFGFEIKDFDYGTIHFLFREIFIKNEYFFKTSKKAPIIFDCGANIGFSIIYLKWLYPKSIIYAFEADPNAFKILSENVAKNNIKNIFLHNVALSGKNGKITFYVDKERPGWLSASGVKERFSKDKIEVTAAKLSGFISKNIDFIKMDIEGMEYEVLNEITKSKKIDKIENGVIEFHNNINGTGRLPDFLEIVGKSKFSYSIGAVGSFENQFQDIIVHIKK
jgi:FkbM family methyltransferase